MALQKTVNQAKLQPDVTDSNDSKGAVTIYCARGPFLIGVSPPLLIKSAMAPEILYITGYFKYKLSRTHTQKSTFMGC